MVLTEAEGLLMLAAADLETAEASSDPLIFREGAWGFWMRQAIEKALKAWLVLLGETPPLTPDLDRLLLSLEQHGVNIAPFQELTQFTIYAVQFRYDPTSEPLGLDRPPFQRMVHALSKLSTLGLNRPPVPPHPGIDLLHPLEHPHQQRQHHLLQQRDLPSASDRLSTHSIAF
jgi:HEPN domain-containing protein